MRTKQYQPKTGQTCHCKPGVHRDNCPDCEGTGMRVDFAAIRNMARSRYPYVGAIAWNGSTPCTYSVKLSPELPVQTVCCDNEQAAIELATQILLVGRPACECGNTNAGWHGDPHGHRYYACADCAHWYETQHGVDL